MSSKFDQFLPVRFYFVSKRPENFVRIAKFPYAAFGPLFAFHCPLFVTKNNNLGWNRHASPHTGTCRCNDHGPTELSARGQLDASNDVLAAAEGWAHCGHPSKRDCRQRAGT